ncbi:MAG: hypothetical protein IKK22_05515 [Firmicutes bacterium]|nr:hypothetical protein [Bacillota bacterium]MBR4074858.1 hypothetical protein [Bacillota bacterium]MBR7149282.1 hypothetical protein [Bacillota bacterium]
MNPKLQCLFSNKKLYYVLLTIITISAMILLSGNVFSQDRDGRHQIIDKDGGEELMVNGTLKTQEELRLQMMLSNISGVGDNQVMITWKEADSSGSVFQSQPEYKELQGVIVAAEGAAHPSVKLSIIDAVTSVYGIPTSSVMVFSLEQ